MPAMWTGYEIDPELALWRNAFLIAQLGALIAQPSGPFSTALSPLRSYFYRGRNAWAHSSWSHRKWDTQISAFGSPAKRHLRATPPGCLASEIIIGIALTRFWHDDPSEVSFPCQLGRKT